MKEKTKKYKIEIYGQVVESCWLSLTKEQFNYWKDKREETIDYCNGFEISNLDDSVNFLLNGDGQQDYYLDSSNVSLVQYGTVKDDCSISIYEVDEEDNFLNTVQEEILLSDFIQKSENNNLIFKEQFNSIHNYFLEYIKTYKGKFFVGYFYAENFSISELQIKSLSNLNDLETIDEIYYSNEKIENLGDFIDLISEDVNYLEY
jgi:hypothetical protein